MNNTSELNQTLIKRRNELASIIELINKQQQSLDNISGSLYIKDVDNHTEYYHEIHTPDRKRTYIRKHNKLFAKQLAQKSYYDEVLPRLESELSKIDNLLIEYHKPSIDTIFTQYKNSRKELVTPIAISDEEFALKWQSQVYISKPFLESDPTNHYTNKNERVRSKSEIIIANFFKDQNIPYKYECPLKLAKTIYPGPIYPDFTVLNKRTRKIYYLEHLGSVDDSDYMLKNLTRFKDYERNGIILGDKLLITYESSKMPLDLNLLKSLAQTFLI